jgi:hypothetical protein
MDDAREELVDAVARELAAPAPSQALDVCDEIRRRHGASVAAVLFYGSCLRKRRPDEGVLDFYAIVDGYREAYASPLLAWSNALLPPNVFYVEIERPTGVIRSKYAVISLADFARACGPASLHAIVWGRFSQPSVLAWSRDDSVSRRVAECLAEAVLTVVLRATALLVGVDGAGDLPTESIWQRGFEETYATELRTESRETIAGIYRAAPERYDRFARLAFEVLAGLSRLNCRISEDRCRVSMDPARRRSLLVGWRLRRPLAKLLYAVRLVKSALTFGDWLPYAIWKLNRHTGVHIEPTASQRRHPFLFGWPLILRLLWQQKLR